MNTLAIVFALLLLGQPPEGWEQTDVSKLGIDAFRYEHTDGTVVVVYEGVGNIFELAGSVARRIGDSYPQRYLDIAEGADYVAGHSAGGAIASWIGYVLEIPSITYGSGRTSAALLNDGTMQVNYVTENDPAANPFSDNIWNTQPPLNGEYIILPEYTWGGLPWYNAHSMETYHAALEVYYGVDSP